MPQLRDINVDELSLVHRGANRRRFFLKADEPAELDPAFAAALVEKADGEEQLLKALAAGDAETGRAAVAAYRLLKAQGENLPGPLAELVKQMGEMDCPEGEEEPDEEEVAKADSDAGDEIFKADFTAEQRAAMAKNGHAMPDESYPIPNVDYLKRAIRAVGRGNEPHADIRAHIVKRAKALGATDLLPDSWNVSKEDLEMADTATVPVKKEDGTWDLSGLPEEQHEFMKELLEKADRAEAAEAEKVELEKAAEDAKKSEDEALRIAKEEREIRLTGVYLAKAEDLGQDVEFAPVLKTIAAAVEPEVFEKLEAVLKANHERAVTAGIYDEIGKSGATGGENSAQAQLQAKADEIRKSDGSLTKEQALTKAYADNPELFKQLRSEES